MPMPKCTEHELANNLFPSFTEGCAACDLLRKICLHNCGDACRREGCVLMHKGYVEARSCSSCGSMGMNCFPGCEQDEDDWKDHYADLAASHSDDAEFHLPDSDTTGPKDPPL